MKIVLEMTVEDAICILYALRSHKRAASNQHLIVICSQLAEVLSKAIMDLEKVEPEKPPEPIIQLERTVGHISEGSGA